MAELVMNDSLTSISADALEAAAPATNAPQTHGARVAPRSAATVEHMLYALIFLGGLAARLFALGAAPMATTEAATAWAAWMDASALHPTVAPATSSALLHALQTFTFWVSGGGNETLARLPVALLSSLIVLLPWFWRARLGRPAALVLALLLALDPWLLTFGRMADATALSAALALVALTAMHVATRHADYAPSSSRAVASAIAAAGAGLLLVSGPQAWSWLLVLALYLWIAAADRSALFNIRTLLIGGAAALLGATGWFAWPQELAMVGASLDQWLGALRAGPYPLLWPFTRLLVDQPFVLVFGVAGFILLWLQTPADATQRAARRFLAAWLALALLILLLPGRAPAALPLLSVPLAACAALAVQWLYRLTRATNEWSEAVLLALVLVAALMSILFWCAQSLAQAAPAQAGALVAPLLLGVVALLLAAFAWLVSRRQALVVGAAVTGLFLLAATFSAAHHLAFAHSPAHPNGFFANTTWHDAATLRADVQSLSDRRTGDPTELAVQVVTGPTHAADPLIGWLMRDMRNAAYVTAPVIDASAAPGRAPLVIMAPSSDEAAQSAWNSEYVGSTVRLRSNWLPNDLPSLTGYEDGEQRWNAGWRPRLRWLLYRAAPNQPEPETVNLWATP